MYNYIFLTGLIALGFWQLRSKDTVIISEPEIQKIAKKELERAPAVKPPLPSKAEVSQMRAPAEALGKTSISLNKESKTSQNFTTEKHPALPEGFELATNVFGIRTKDYAASMGDVIQENKSLTFVRSDSRPPEASLVAFDKANNTFYSIGSVLKLENVNESARQDLLDKGLVEHYYHEALKTMYVQSTPSNILGLYQDLHELKLEPQLEMTKGFHRPR